MHAGCLRFGCEPARARARQGIGYLDPAAKPSPEGRADRIKRVGSACIRMWDAPTKTAYSATGLDEANRKQYRYHPLWSEAQSGAKFDNLHSFGQALPQVRRSVESILSGAKKDDVFAKEVAIAAVVRLLDHTAMRIGGRSRTSQGATTLMLRNIRYTKTG